MTNNILECCGIEKSFFGVKVLHNISFSMQKGHILGLIGENGAGKSTLVNILDGIVQADAGSIKLDGVDYAPKNPREAARSGVALIHQELNLFTNLSIAENIFIQGFPRVSVLPLIDKRAVRAHVRSLLDTVDLHVSPDILVERLSPGERQLVEIAKAVNTDARLIIFDEPTTSLTARETERLFSLIERLREQGKSIIYISHILGDVHRLSDEIIVLRDGELVGTGMRDRLPIDRMISLMVGRNLEQLYPTRDTVPASEIVLKVEGLSQPGIIENITFSLHKGEVLGIFGLMGSGRTELARILFGLDPFERGKIELNGEKLPHLKPAQSIEHRVAFVTENRREEGLLMDMSIAENMALVSLPHFASSGWHFVNRSKLLDEVRQMGDALHLKSTSLERQAVKSLSGGNQQKVVLGKWLLSHPRLFIMDEPTRGIDVGAKHEIYTIINQLASQGTGVLLISSEIEEVIGTCDRILVMSYGEIQASFQRDEFDQEQILRAAFREKVGS